MHKDIELEDVKYQQSKTLSGGQKRKLSVAIAMIGNSKIVLLDEPSSGMDTSARRRMWEMLKKNKNGKIVILTTQYMDEADILGDRIAIMAEGDV
jgi:ABC-type multidrug transport system ATPase subunit